MKSFEPEGFKEYYDCILKGMQLEGKQLKGHYIDPDSVRDVKKTEYYNWLTVFLNCREQEMQKKQEIGGISESKFLFLPPKEARNTSEEDKKNEHIDKSKIIVLKDNKPCFRLTSDQFGFSAEKSIYFCKSKAKYPLYKMILLSQDKTEKEKEEIRQQIIEYVKNSRTIGGAFVWPIPNEGRRVSQYNKSRGVKSYLEDRVDLTLLEIKHTLDGEYDKGNFKSDILYNEYMENVEHMREWLEHFKTFNNYIEYFMLEPFVVDREVDGKKEKIPINIISDEPIDTNEVENYKEQHRVDQIGKLQQLNLEELQRVIVKVEEMILQRTKSIEKVIREKGISYVQRKAKRHS